MDTPPARPPCGDVVIERPAPVAEPATMVIFGATGDLAKRKLIPALYHLTRQGLLPERFSVVGVGRDAMTTEVYSDKVRADLDRFTGDGATAVRCDWLESRLAYVSGDFDGPDLFGRLAALLQEHGERGVSNVLFYLAVPPSLFEPIVARLGAAGLDREDGGWRRVVVEKPFGNDLTSARALNRSLRHVLEETQIYRIDHYLGKETAQNLVAFRFANGIFEPIWDRRYIDHVQITVAERVGVEGRGRYYDSIGALRDMVQNHLFQLLALTAMEPPMSFKAEAVRDERLKVLKSIRPIAPSGTSVVRAQYRAGAVDGTPAVGYREEPRVPADSTTETYVALELLIDNWRWSGVPFYLRTGKRLRQRVSEIVVQFKGAPLMLFRDSAADGLEPNQLVLRLQPDEGIALSFQAKIPGPKIRLATVRMDFSYADYFSTQLHTGYETLLYDVMQGDPTLFHRADIVEAGWEIVQPLIEAWAGHRTPVDTYEAGTWGPESANDLITRGGRAWRVPTARPAL